MTEKQSHLYLRMWRDAVAANHWHTAKGAAVIDPERLTEMGSNVVAMARAMALADARACKLEDLRHACHVLALGRDKSSKDLTNAELDRVLSVIRLVTDGEDIDALIALDHPEIGVEKRLNWAIEHAAPEAYVRQVAGDKYGTRLWEGLHLDQKHQLLMTLKSRSRSRQEPAAPEPEPEPEPAEAVEQPF